MTTPTDENLQPAVAAEFAALADFLASTDEDRWNDLSLCDGWLVRNVVAHLTMPARYSPEEFEAELRESRFDFDDLSNRIATRDSERPIQELLEDLRSETMCSWTPPRGGWTGALTHVVIHGLDITAALRVDRLSPDATITTVLDALTEGGIHTNFGTGIDGLELQATDLDWAFGSGRVVAARAQDLALALSGSFVQLAMLSVVARMATYIGTAAAVPVLMQVARFDTSLGAFKVIEFDVSKSTVQSRDDFRVRAYRLIQYNAITALGVIGDPRAAELIRAILLRLVLNQAAMLESGLLRP